MRHERLLTQPLYRQARDRLVARIAAGEWKPGTLLPNEIDLAREFSVSLGTMRKALEMLEAEYLVTRKQGRGTFVNDLASQDQGSRYCNLRIRGKPVRGDMRTVALTEEPADPSERRRLQLAPDQLVYRIRRARAYQGRPFMVEHVSLPAALFPGLAERNVIPLALPELAQAYGILLGRGQECV